MFDVILQKIKAKTSFAVENGLMSAEEESVIVSMAPKSYNGTLCKSELKLVCIGKTYERALESFTSVCDGLYELPYESGEVSDVDLKDALIRYDSSSGMTRLIGKFEILTEGLSDD